MAPRKTGRAASAATQKKLEIEHRRRVVAANLLAGHNYRDLAQQLNVSVGTIANDVRALLKDWRTNALDDADSYVQLQLRRLDVLLNAIWDEARNGNHQAIDRALNIMERQAKLLGLDQEGLLVKVKPESDLPIMFITPSAEATAQATTEDDDASSDG